MADLSAWPLRADPRSQIGGRVALAFAVAPDLSTSSVAVAGRRADGLNHGELTDPPQPGTGGLIVRLEDLWALHDPVVLTVNGIPGAQSALLKELNEHGWVVVPPGKPVPPGKRRLQVTGSQEFAQACGALVQDVVNDRWRHLGQGPLDAAAAGARTRPLADAWAWSWPRSLADIGPLEAVTLARHGHATFGVLSAPDPDVF